VVLLSSSSTPSGNRNNAVAKYHLESEDAVRASGMGWTFLQPNAFMSNALRWRPQVIAGEAIREPFGDIALSVVDPADIASVALLALTTADHHARSYRLSGPEALTAAERAEVLGEALGRKLTVVVPSDEDAREGLPPAYAGQATRRRVPQGAADLPDVNEVFTTAHAEFRSRLRRR
jgi:uncharacterized protein YbjT (DUF2867 family)